MEPLGLALIVGGIVAIAFGALRIRGPLAIIRRLDETEANLTRYESWRGKRTGVEADGPTGADTMRALMRRHAILWGGFIGAGAILIVAGLVIR